MSGGRSSVARSGHGGGISGGGHSSGGRGGAGTGGHGGHGGGYRGFKSKKQWRWAWASGQPWADKKSHETAGGPKIRYRRLPESKHSGRKGSRVPTGINPAA